MSENAYNVRAAKIWPWTQSTETYGTGVALNQLRGISIEMQYDTDELKVLGAVEETLAVAVSAEGVLRMAGFEDGLWDMIGTDDSSSGADTHINNEDGGDDAPYFGLAVAIALKGGGDKHVYLPKVQLQKSVDIDLGEDNQFLIPDLDYKAMRLRLASGTTYPVRKSFTKATATALADVDDVLGLS